MKKRTISAIILMALIIATFSIFTTPASADADINCEPEIIEPGDTINAYERYCEFEINLPTAGEYSFPLYIHSGYHIMQTFGGLAHTQLEILNSNNDLLVSYNNTKDDGYLNNPFIHYDFSSDAYILKVRGDTKIRLSITRAMDFATVYGTLPMTCFEDIVVAESLTCRFYADSPAVVFRYIPTNTQARVIALSGSSTIRVYLMDPSSKTAFDEIVVSGEGTYDTPTLYAGRPYYVVFYQPVGPEGDSLGNELEYIEGTVSIS